MHIDAQEAGSKVVQVLYHRHQISIPISSLLYDRGGGKEKEIYPKYECFFDGRDPALRAAGERLVQSIGGCPD